MAARSVEPAAFSLSLFQYIIDTCALNVCEIYKLINPPNFLNLIKFYVLKYISMRSFVKNAFQLRNEELRKYIQV